MPSSLRWLGLLSLCLLLFANSVSAQSETLATLTPPETQAFPRISAYLDVHDPQGFFVHGLSTSDIRVLEDGHQVNVVEFDEIRPGVQVVFALNPGDSFVIRDSQGFSRYDMVVEAISNWAQYRQGSSLDDVSVYLSAGPVRTHFSDPMTVVTTLQGHELDAAAFTPSLDALLQAVDIAADPSPRPGMERSVLFITSPLEGDLSFGIQNLISRANQNRVHINVWMVSSTELFSSPNANQLLELAAQTGGEFYAFSGVEQLPDPEEYLLHLRDIYHLAYDSEINEGGVHRLQVDIQHSGEQIDTAEQDFELDLQPPNPAFISPTLEITRQLPEGSRNYPWDQVNMDDLVPNEQELEVLVDFPDGRIRSLVRTSLLVDGEVVAENTEEPFEKFTWDLSAYLEGGQHMLQVEALDELGLSATSIETPVNITVILPPQNPLASLSQYVPLIAWFLGIISVAVILLVLILGGRIRPRSLGMVRGLRRSQGSELEPAAQQGASKGDMSLGTTPSQRRLGGWVNRLHWPQRRLSPKAFAYLTRQSEAEEAITESPISITTAELTLGSDPSLATLVLDDPSVDAIHARLIREEGDSMRIFDEDSVAGTWINYQPVPREGALLEHGDTIHLGKVRFQFALRQPKRVRKPVVTVHEAPE